MTDLTRKAMRAGSVANATISRVSGLDRYSVIPPANTATEAILAVVDLKARLAKNKAKNPRAARLSAAALHVLLMLAVCGALVVSASVRAADAPAFEVVKSAVVRIAVSERGHSGIGTIVTAEGHIILHGAGHLKGRSLIVHLPDGRRAKGVLQGWS